MRRISVVLSAVVVVVLASAMHLTRTPVAAQQASPAAGTACPVTTEEENEALVRRYQEEAWGQGNVDTIEEIVDEDFVIHVPGVTGYLPGATSSPPNRAAMIETVQAFRTDFPDLRVTIEETIAEGDMVAMRSTFAGTQADPFDLWNAPDTGRSMEREVWTFYRVACGRMAEGWILPDNLTMLRQLGIITDDELANAGTPTVATPMP
jgi:predicted ester cyclase